MTQSIDLTAIPGFKADSPAAVHHPKRHRWTIWHSLAAWAGFWLIVGLYLGVAL